jgi:hypothetical protein
MIAIRDHVCIEANRESSCLDDTGTARDGLFLFWLIVRAMGLPRAAGDVVGLLGMGGWQKYQGHQYYASQVEHCRENSWNHIDSPIFQLRIPSARPIIKSKWSWFIPSSGIRKHMIIESSMMRTSLLVFEFVLSRP